MFLTTNSFRRGIRSHFWDRNVLHSNDFIPNRSRMKWWWISVCFALKWNRILRKVYDALIVWARFNRRIRILVDIIHILTTIVELTSVSLWPLWDPCIRRAYGSTDSNDCYVRLRIDEEYSLVRVSLYYHAFIPRTINGTVSRRRVSSCYYSACKKRKYVLLLCTKKDESWDTLGKGQPPTILRQRVMQVYSTNVRQYR